MFYNSKKFQYSIVLLVSYMTIGGDEGCCYGIAWDNNFHKF